MREHSRECVTLTLTSVISVLFIISIDPQLASLQLPRGHWSGRACWVHGDDARTQANMIDARKNASYRLRLLTSLSLTVGKGDNWRCLHIVLSSPAPLVSERCQLFSRGRINQQEADFKWSGRLFPLHRFIYFCWAALLGTSA